VTKTEDARKTPRGAVHHLDAHGPSAIPLTSRGLSDLAATAMARLIDNPSAGDLSEEAKACMQSPMATALATALCDDMTDIADLMVSISSTRACRSRMCVSTILPRRRAASANGGKPTACPSPK
jgi:hypothetical protein